MTVASASFFDDVGDKDPVWVNDCFEVAVGVDASGSQFMQQVGGAPVWLHDARLQASHGYGKLPLAASAPGVSGQVAIKLYKLTLPRAGARVFWQLRDIQAARVYSACFVCQLCFVLQSSACTCGNASCCS